MRADQIRAGMQVVLRDGTTVVTITDAMVIDEFRVKLEWIYRGLPRYMVYAPDDEIQVAQPKDAD